MTRVVNGSVKKANKPFRSALIVALLISLVGVEVVRRAVHGSGRVHKLARAIYHEYHHAQPEFNAPPERAEANMVLYSAGLGSGWQDWSWATHSLASTAHLYTGAHSIEMTPEAFKAIYLHHEPMSLAGYGAVRIALFGNSALNVSLADENGKFGAQARVDKYYDSSSQKASWRVAVIPLKDLGIQKLGFRISGIAIQAAGAEKQSNVSIDDVAMLPDLSLPSTPVQATIRVTIDATADRHEISPFIYGMAFAPQDYLKDLRLGSNRWGGNDKSRYNWVNGNACNAARDWRWANKVSTTSVVPASPSSAADLFVMDNWTSGTGTVLTVPTIGWVARDSDNANTSMNVPNQGGSPISNADGAISGYDPSDNRVRTSLRSVARKGQPFTDSPSTATGVVFEDEWVHHIVKRFGTAAHGGVRFYSMDNEPDIWDSTHTDVHPARMGYDDMLHNFLEYASAVKDVDASSEVTGPVLSGFTAYLYSSLDRGDDNFQAHADCTKHGGEAFLLWFLKQVKSNDVRTGHRLLDVLDVHYYPQGQGIYGGAADKDTQERRVRATRSLWDSNYVDESWIHQPVRLIPRLKEWIAGGYPGTKIGITEWNYGGEKDMSGAVAISDVLGIFGREGVYLANYWAYPQKSSPGYLAFKLFRNADNSGHGFGDESCHAASADSNSVSCFAATDRSTSDLSVILVNKMRKTSATVPVSVANWHTESSSAKAWLLSSEHPGILTPQPGPVIRNGELTVTLPPYSVLLLRMPTSAQGKSQSK